MTDNKTMTAVVNGHYGARVTPLQLTANACREKISQAERRDLKENVTAIEKEKAEKITTTSDDYKVIVKYPENVSDVVRQEKINHIYDILAKHIGE